MAPKHWMIIWTLRRYLFCQLCVWIYLWWMYQHRFYKPFQNQLSLKYMLTQFAESRSPFFRKSAFHKVVLKMQQYYWGPFVDTLMLQILKNWSSQNLYIKEPSLAGWEVEVLRLSGLSAVLEGVCGSAKTWTYTLSASIQNFIPEMSHLWTEKN